MSDEAQNLPARSLPEIVVRHGIYLKTFREEIVPANESVILEDLVRHWPAVQAAQQGPRALGDYPNPVTLFVESTPVAGQHTYRTNSRKQRGMLGLPTPERAQAIRNILLRALSRCRQVAEGK